MVPFLIFIDEAFMDSKLQTFLTLCQTMNYRMAAERLHLSQPAVTKQIQALEQELNTKLFFYDGHTLHKTEKCLILERYAISLQYQFDELKLAISDKERLRLRPMTYCKYLKIYVKLQDIQETQAGKTLPSRSPTCYVK